MNRGRDFVKMGVKREAGFVSSSMTITSGNFDEEVLRSSIPVLIDFWAPWCGPCKMIGPIIDQLAEEYSGRLKVCKVNVDEEPALAQQHGIVSIPMMILYKDGSIVHQKAGAAQKQEIETLFKNLI